MFKDGRLAQTYVYMLLCAEDASIAPDSPLYFKIGITDHLHKRLMSLKNNCPVEARWFYSTPTPGREIARRIEYALHRSLAEWRMSGEWFRVYLDDKDSFNHNCKFVLNQYRKPGMDLKWDRLHIEPYVLNTKKGRPPLDRTYEARLSRAFKDLKKDSA